MITSFIMRDFVLKVSFSKVDFSGLPKSSSTVRRGRDQAGGCARPAVGGPFLFEGPIATERKVRFSRSPRLGGFLRPASTTAELGDGVDAPPTASKATLNNNRFETSSFSSRHGTACPGHLDQHGVASDGLPVF